MQAICTQELSLLTSSVVNFLTALVVPLLFPLPSLSCDFVFRACSLSAFVRWWSIGAAAAAYNCGCTTAAAYNCYWAKACNSHNWTCSGVVILFCFFLFWGVLCSVGRKQPGRGIRSRRMLTAGVERFRGRARQLWVVCCRWRIWSPWEISDFFGEFFVFEVKKFKSLEVEVFLVAMLFCRSTVCG